MKRDEKGRYNYQRSGTRFPEPMSPRPWVDDNLAPTDDDEDLDPDEHFNWRDNPIRSMFDNPVDSSHRSYREEPSFPDEEEE
jgi:hypothetical protein